MSNYQRGYTCGEEACLTRVHLETALLKLVQHDVAADNREGLPGSYELKVAIDVLAKHCGYNESFYRLVLDHG